MEKYIILVDDTISCNDFHCEINRVKGFYKAKITAELVSDMIITGANQNEFYTKLVSYIFDCGRIISIIPVSEKNSIIILQSYVRIEEIRRHLSRLKGDI